MNKSTWLLCLFVVPVVLGCNAGAQRNDGETSYKVVRVVDGDTVRIMYQGREESVRLLGVDTPETVHPRKPVEHYDPEAATFTRNLLRGETVFLKFGEKERDFFGRLLVFMYRAPDGLFVNLEIIRQGYGRTTPSYEYPHKERFIELERQAKAANKGLWSEAEVQAITRRALFKNSYNC